MELFWAGVTLKSAYPPARRALRGALPPGRCVAAIEANVLRLQMGKQAWATSRTALPSACTFPSLKGVTPSSSSSLLPRSGELSRESWAPRESGNPRREDTARRGQE